MYVMAERRDTQRVPLSLSCTLRRRTSSPIWAETIDVGEGGMSVRATRPLREDETIEFDLAEADVSGRARVVRHGGPRVYGLRFEGLQDQVRARLTSLVQTGV
jgi:c-di-GMP-binding flagellar brake protein YcgR